MKLGFEQAFWICKDTRLSWSTTSLLIWEGQSCAHSQTYCVNYCIVRRMRKARPNELGVRQWCNYALTFSARLRVQISMSKWQRINYSSERVGVIKTMSDMTYRFGPNQMTLESVSPAQNTTDGQRKETTKRKGRNELKIIILIFSLLYNIWHYSYK